jgi:hypothetical protein
MYVRVCMYVRIMYVPIYVCRYVCVYVGGWVGGCARALLYGRVYALNTSGDTHSLYSFYLHALI